MDARSLLKLGDERVSAGDYTAAIEAYERAGRFYAEQGFALKALAIYEQIREIIRNDAPHLRERYAHVPAKLAELREQLGLVSDVALDDFLEK